MVLKKKKKKGSKKKKTKSKSKSVGPDPDDRVENSDPSTLISGTTQTGPDTGSGKSTKKKKVKKKKMTKEERAQEKLEKNMDKIRKEPEIFTNFVDRMDRWLRQVAPRAKQMFKKIDKDGEGLITYELFKSGMFDLNIPLNKIELHLLATLLDTDNSGDIDYSMLDDGLQHVRDGDEEGDDDDDDEDREDELEGGEGKEGAEEETEPSRQLKLIPTDRKLNTCACCKMLIDQPYKEKNPRYVQMELRLVTFDKFKAHPGHVNVLVHSHLHVFGLIQLLVQLTYVQSTKISIFRDRTRSKDARLLPNLTLEDCSYVGGSKERPQEIVLFYDYTVEFTDCPILICDHYFGQSLKAI